MGQRLQDEVAIVTGSNSGIGLATALEMAKEGADVCVTCFRGKDGATSAVKEIEGMGRRAVLVELDQRDPESVAAMFETTKKALGTPTILVNNAGISPTNKPVGELSFEEWDRVIRTDLYGPFFCCGHFIRGLEGSGRHGTIINISSVHQELARAGWSNYNAAKGGLRNLMRCIALEVADKNINVVNIGPGMILTPMNQAALDDPKKRQEQEQNIPMKRAGRPEEIAKLAVFLASEDARYIHGTTVFADGALMLQLGQGA